MSATYTMNIFKDNQIEHNWNTIKVGWDLKYLNIEEIKLYAIDYVKTYPELSNLYISELILETESNKIEEHIKNIFTSLNLAYPDRVSYSWNEEWRKWRFCIINTMLKYISNEEQFIHEVQNMYEDLGGPIDMQPFVFYTTPDNNQEKLENYKCIIKRIICFLEYEKTLIETGYVFLPEKIGDPKIIFDVNLMVKEGTLIKKN